jgi:FAD:protein FMN transferase
MRRLDLRRQDLEYVEAQEERRAPSGDVSLQLFSASHPAMGTDYSLYLYASSPEEADCVAVLVFQEIDRVEELLSNYRESSELSRINREATQHEVTTDPETFHFLETCMAWSEKSQGAFDISVGKVMKVWNFFGESGALPRQEELAAARDAVGWQKIHLDSARRTVRFLSPGIELDPGGIGKGYAVDRAVRVLRARYIPAALISAGNSTVYALGAPVGETGWKIQVPAASPEEGTISRVVLRDTSLSTANRSEKNFIHDGHLYGSIMNPQTLQPVEGMLQVTVISSSATNSDALSNALFVLGPEGRTQLLDQRRQDSALVILGNQQAAQYEATRWPAEVAGVPCAEPADVDLKEK